MKNRIKEFREKLGLTQKRLGELIGVSRQAVNAIETEKFEPSIWIAYEDVYKRQTLFCSTAAKGMWQLSAR